MIPLKLDSVDVAILKALTEDGRRSYRQLAKIVKVSTPTVGARLKRILQSGLISRVAPIYNPSKLDRGIAEIMWLKVEAIRIADVANKIAQLEEVKSVFMTTAEGNLLVKIVVNSYDKLQAVYDKIEAIEKIRILSTQTISKTIKDEQGVIIEPDI